MNSISQLFSRARYVALAAAALGLCPSWAQAQTPLSFYPLTPCRLWDTRNPPGPSGGPKLNANTERSFPVEGLCGVPATAVAVVVNLTVTASTDFGNLRAFPAGTTAPLASVLNFPGTGDAIANGAILVLGDSGGNHLTIRVDMPVGSTGQVHNLCDVTGYFQ